jgi:hypothetical protein
VIDAIGTGFILLCVSIIAHGGAGESSQNVEIKSDEQMKEEKLNLVLALLFAMITGLTITMNTLTAQYTIHTGFDPD